MGDNATTDRLTPVTVQQGAVTFGSITSGNAPHLCFHSDGPGLLLGAQRLRTFGRQYDSRSAADAGGRERWDSLVVSRELPNQRFTLTRSQVLAPTAGVITHTLSWVTGHWSRAFAGADMVLSYGVKC